MAKKEKIVLLANDKVGKSMAGPGIRYWELAKNLAAHYEVVLASAHPSDLDAKDFAVIQLEKGAEDRVFGGAKSVVLQYVNLHVLRWQQKYGFELIVDAYDPVVFETWEMVRGKAQAEVDAVVSHSEAVMNLSLGCADKLICASEKQLDLWYGQLAGLKKLSTDTYFADTTMRSVLDVVAFGMDSKPPKKTGQGLREKFGLDKDDFVLLWGGGIWDWFDPLSLIRAVAKASRNNSKLKLVFMGVQHPGDAMSDEMNSSMLKQTIQLSEDLGLTDKHVFFNFGWVEYHERQNFLLESNVGVSTHFDHVETRFSFRTRMLDYLWTGLPIIATQGDSFADDIAQHGLGEVVGFEDVDGIVDAINKLSKANTRTIIANIEQYKRQYYWSEQAKQLQGIINSSNKLAKLSNRELRRITQDFERTELAFIKLKHSALGYYPRYAKRKLIKLKNSLI
jgi:glycosyltransferase involved in cell wall biosynthesis